MIRVQIKFEMGEKDFHRIVEFFLLERFPCSPVQGDIFDLSSIVSYSEDVYMDLYKFPENVTDFIYSMAFAVEFVEWSRDKEGLYIMVFLKGE